MKTKDELLIEIKEKVAEWNGFKLQMPTKWDYAMKITHRTNKQLLMYDEVIDLLLDIMFLNEAKSRSDSEGK